ncbi:hypothetical protein [Sphingopyxis sp. QXT-31]|uniref:hypothetical protein n=1 Tax=Sphingopyxis sp. QXT-31 TaxID=1357916 RepID=UPI001E623BD3|nr:hypothetical protein [Sphingopyxis sp. QXT-31]
MMGWLHAVPKPPEGSKRATATEQNRLSRYEQQKKDGLEPRMPPNPMPHFIAWLVEIGMVEGGGMGPAPLSWREIAEWQRSVNVRLSPWEARLMRHLSAAYVGEKAKAESENYPAPWRSEVTQRERDIEEARLRSVLG